MKLLREWVLYIFMAALGSIYLAPLVLMFVYSLMPLTQIGQFPPNYIPEEFQWINYISALKFWNFYVGFKNTMLITILTIIGNVLSSSFVAYGFARFEFPGRNILFSILLGTMMLPFAVTMVPLFLGYNYLGMINTFFPLVLPHYFGVAFFIFLLRQFYLSIPKDYLDAARIDGASEITIWWRIMIPLSKPAILVVIILSFQHAWDDFIQPLIYLQDENLQTLSLGLYRFRALPGQGSIVNEMMAASVMLTVPQILVFLFFQKQILDGANLSGVKG